MLRELYHLGPSVCFLPSLIRYYKVLLMTERGEEAIKVVDRICDVLKNELHLSFGECGRIAKRFYEKKEYFLSILFDLIGCSLLYDFLDSDKILLGITKSLKRLQNCVATVAKTDSFLETLKYFIVPKIRNSLDEVFDDLEKKSKRVFVKEKVMSKHAVEIMERNVRDLNAAEVTLRDCREQLLSVFGEKANRLQLFGIVLNNLGLICLQQGNLDEAKDLLAKAIQVNIDAADYASEEKRQQNIQRATNALEQVEEILKC